MAKFRKDDACGVFRISMRKWAVVLLAGLASGCASTPAPQPVLGFAPPPAPPGGSPESGTPINTQQYLKVTKRWNSNGPNYDWTGLYTSVVITDTSEANTQSNAISRNYDDEKRDILSRFF